MFSTILLSNSLITPSVGLVVWQTVTFLVVLFLLSKFAWKPIMAALSDREKSIEDALGAAEAAKTEMAQLTASNAELLKEARNERDKILKDAKTAADKMVDAGLITASMVKKKSLVCSKTL
jgi:F-type H+-transporting ATPase subunit b